MAVVIDVAPDGVHAAALEVGAADTGFIGHILEGSIAAIVKQMIAVVAPGIDDVKIGVAIAIVIAGRGRGADRRKPRHDVREDFVQLDHRMHVATAGLRRPLFEMDISADIGALPRREPDPSQPEEGQHDDCSK